MRIAKSSRYNVTNKFSTKWRIFQVHKKKATSLAMQVIALKLIDLK